MEWKDIGQFIKKFAPILGTAIAGPAGGAVGGAVSLLLSGLGLSGDATPEQAMAAMQAHPELAVELRRIESDHQVELAKIALASDQAYLADRQSARQADVEKTKVTGKRDYALYILAAVIVAGFFWLTYKMMTIQLPQGSSQAVFLLFGGLNTSFAAVVGYFFGSSKGSADKNAIIAQKP
jgi:hypothetical protein